MTATPLELSVTTGGLDEAFSLQRWLDRVPELRGRSRVVPGPISAGELGGMTDVVHLVLENGGTETVGVMTGAILQWLTSRRQRHPLKVTVTRGSRTIQVEVDPHCTAAAEQLLRAISDEP